MINFDLEVLKVGDYLFRKRIVNPIKYLIKLNEGFEVIGCRSGGSICRRPVISPHYVQQNNKFSTYTATGVKLGKLNISSWLSIVYLGWTDNEYLVCIYRY
jgi:hypothetical protein